MYPDWSVFASGAVLAVFITLVTSLLIWLVVLSFLIWQQRGFFRSLFPKSGERDIRKKFEEVLQDVADSKVDMGNLAKRLEVFEKKSLANIQRVELLRFNPYEDTGGDQSFTLALLDKEGTGIVLTSLHARSGTRVFAKSVIKGESSKYQFSKEEKEVVSKAMRL